MKGGAKNKDYGKRRRGEIVNGGKENEYTGARAISETRLRGENKDGEAEEVGRRREVT